MKCTDKKCFLVTILLFSLFLSAYSQDNDTTDNVSEKDTIENLDMMVITATRTKRLMSETPSAVSIITEAEIELAPAKNIDDLLQYEPSVQMKRVVGMAEGIPSDIIIRGIPGALTATRTLVLVDGIPTNVSGTPFLILNELPNEAIKNVEILRGTYSSLYGANAFSGVVNIITKSGYGKPGLNMSFETSYPFSALYYGANQNLDFGESLRKAGKDTYYSIGGISSGGNDKVHYMTTFGYRTIGNYYLADSALVKHDSTWSYKSIENHDYRDIRFFAKCGVTPNDNIDLEFHFRFFDSELGFGLTKYLSKIRKYPVIRNNEHIVNKGRKIVVGPIASIRVNDFFTLNLKAYYRTLVGQFWYEEPDTLIKYEVKNKDGETKIKKVKYSVPGYWKSQTQDWLIETQGIITAGSHNILTVGLEYLGNYINFHSKINTWSDTIIPGTYPYLGGISNGAVYIQDEITIADKVNIVPGIRFDLHSDFGFEFSPRIGGSYNIVDWFRIRSSFGRGFRAPTLSELFMPDLAIRHDFVLACNPNLTAEHISSFDVGMDFTPIKTLKMQAGFFSNIMHDLIYLTLDLRHEDNFAITYENVARAWSRGLEVEFDWQIKPWLSTTGNYVFQRSRNERASEVRDTFNLFGVKTYTEKEKEVPLDYVPNHSAALGFTFGKKIRNVLVEATIGESFVGIRRYLEWTEASDKIDTILTNNDKDTIFIPNDVFEYDNREYIDPPLIKLPSCWRTDFSIKTTINEHLWIALNIQNLFNAKFEEQGGTLSPGRFASIKIGTGF